jgi:hypothetical protein
MVVFLSSGPCLADTKVPTGHYTGTVKLKTLTFSCPPATCPFTLPVDIILAKNGSQYVYQVQEGAYQMTKKRTKRDSYLRVALAPFTVQFPDGVACTFTRVIGITRNVKRRIILAYIYNSACSNGDSGLVGYEGRIRKVG